MRKAIENGDVAIYKLLDWTYIFGKENDETYFNIIPDRVVQKPDILFKLYSLSENSVNALINNYVYATHPNQFNDLFDCNEELINFDDEEDIRIFLRTAYSEEQIDSMLQSNFQSTSTHVQRNFKAVLYRLIGVLSMTEDPFNILMWSYYTNHYGFMLEFDISKFPFKFQGPFPINYQKEISPISVKETGVQLAMLIQTNLKYSDWKHENEWRLLIDSEEPMFSPFHKDLEKLGGHDRKFKYPKEAIKSISLGNRFFSPDEIKILDEKNLQIRLLDLWGLELKRQLMNYIVENNLPVNLAMRGGLTQITFKRVSLIKEGEDLFKFIAT